MRLKCGTVFNGSLVEAHRQLRDEDSPGAAEIVTPQFYPLLDRNETYTRPLPRTPGITCRISDGGVEGMEVLRSTVAARNHEWLTAAEQCLDAVRAARNGHRPAGTEQQTIAADGATRLCAGLAGASGQGSRLADKPLKHRGRQHLIYWLWSVSALT